MKSSLILAAAFALVSSAAIAQTVAPGTTPGAQTGNPSNMPNAGTTTDPISSPDRTTKMANQNTNRDKGTMRKGGKMKTNTDGTMKTKTKM